jgi:hypothetical protein
MYYKILKKAMNCAMKVLCAGAGDLKRYELIRKRFVL